MDQCWESREDCPSWVLEPTVRNQSVIIQSKVSAKIEIKRIYGKDNSWKEVLTFGLILSEKRYPHYERAVEHVIRQKSMCYAWRTLNKW